MTVAHDPPPLDALRADPALGALGLVVNGVLAQGGSAIVYRARDERHGRDVAVKVIRHVPQKVSTDVPVALEAIIARATARDAASRYATADEMADALAALGIGLNVR